MKSNNHIFLIFIYGFFKRRNVVLAHPSKYTFHYLDPLYNLYTKRLYDYNIIDKYGYNELKAFNPEVDNDLGIIKLDVPVIMTSVCNVFEISRPIYNPEQIKIGLILNECKLCNKTINIINKILTKNNKIYLTVYAFCDKTWLFSNFNKKYYSRIELKIYDNHNYMNELQNNLLYIDTILCSGHSTAMEIIKSSRPIIAFKNKTKFFGLVASNIIQHIDMCDELCADNEDKYLELVLHHLQNETNYMELYNQFIYQLEKSNILDNSKYAEELYNKLNELYKSLTNTFISNYTPTDAEIPKLIWTFWDTDEIPELVGKCIETWKKHNPDYKITILKKDNLKDYIPEVDIYGLKHANTAPRISDFVRLHTLKKYGGFWVDASIIMTEPLDFILQKQKEGSYELVGYYLENFTNNYDYPIIESWFFAAIPNSHFINLWCDTFMKINNYDNVSDFTQFILHSGTDTQNINALDYLAIHTAAQYIFQKLITIPDLKGRLFLFKAEDGPYKYLHDVQWFYAELYHEKAFDKLLNDKSCFTPIIKLRGCDRIYLENNSNIKNKLYEIMDSKYPKIHFISFFSEGPPIDNGLDLKKTEKNVYNLINGCLDTFTAYHPKDFANDPEFSWSVKDWATEDQKYARPNSGWWSPMHKKFLDVGKGSDRTGFYAWKIVCIIKKMREIPDGDIVFFHDGNFDKYINYYEGKDKCKTLIHTILNKINCDVFISWEFNSNLVPLRMFCRRQTFEKLAEFSDYYTKYDLLWSGIIIIRKSKLSDEFLNDVLVGCKDIECLSHYPPDNDPELVLHTPEQAILSVIARKYIKENKLPEKWPYFYCSNRIFTKENMLIADHVKDVMSNIS